VRQHTLPHVTALYAKYRDRGLAVVGVHTPEFPFERTPAKVSTSKSTAPLHGYSTPSS
jgi:hypothetical protein